MAFDQNDFFEAVNINEPLRVALYIHAGANLNYKNVLGQTALHIAVEKGYANLIELLLDNGADPYVNTVYGDNCLTLAVRLHTECDILEKLLECGVDPNVENGMGMLAIQCAIMYKKMEHAKVLMKRGANLFLVSSFGKSAFQMLIDPDYFVGTDVLNEFLEQVDCNAQDADGNTLLHRLINAGVPRNVVHKVLKRKANPNAQNNEGNSPLHLAVLGTHSRSYIPLLLGFGANPYLKNNTGQNVFDMLKSVQEFGLYALLRDYAKRHGLKQKFGVGKGGS